jgi:RNA recognition motif-containing protein
MQASSDKKQLDVGANLFIGNLDENVDERLLYDTFSAFGVMATTAKVRLSRGTPDTCTHPLIYRLLVTQLLENQKAMALFRIPISSHRMRQ